MDTAFAQLYNRFAYLREELHSSLCPHYFLMLDIAALDLPIQVWKDYSEVVLIAANRLRHDLHRRRRILLQGVFQLFADTLSLKALAFRQPRNQSRAKLWKAAAQKMGVMTDTASQFLQSRHRLFIQGFRN
jgi:hypothetical protein